MSVDWRDQQQLFYGIVSWLPTAYWRLENKHLWEDAEIFDEYKFNYYNKSATTFTELVDDLMLPPKNIMKNYRMSIYLFEDVRLEKNDKTFVLEHGMYWLHINEDPDYNEWKDNLLAVDSYAEFKKFIKEKTYEGCPIKFTNISHP